MAALKAKYTSEEFQRLIERETNSVELKSGASVQKLQEAMVALSNTDGGIIFIGVTDKREVVGRRLDQGTDDKVHEAALAAFNVGRYSVQQVLIDGVAVVGVEVKRREEGFSQTSDGRLLVRRGGRNVALIGADAWDFMASRALRRFERADSGLRIQDADPALVEEMRKAMGWTTKQLPERLRERGLAIDDGLTIAGALFLTHPAVQLNLRKCVVEVRRYPEDGPDYDRRETFDGPLQDQVRAATQFLMNELGSDLVVTGLYRHELPKVPEVVVREAIANAVAHRSYEVDRAAVVIELRPTAVVVRSPGGLPEPVTVETIRQAQAARNPDIIDVLRHFSLAEDAGRGVDVMEDEMAEALLDPPQFFDDGTSVTVVLPLSGPITSRERAWVAEFERQDKIEPRDRLLLVHAARGEMLTNASARAIFGTEDAGAARRALHRLRDAGLLEQHGERGGATYSLVQDIAPPAAYRLNPRQLGDLIVEAAQEAPLSNADARELTGLDRTAVLALLRSLVATGRLKQTGARRGTRYHAARRK